MTDPTEPTEPAITYDELLAAHREAIDQRDRARRVAVALEQENAEVRQAHTQAILALYQLARMIEGQGRRYGIPLGPGMAAFVAKVEAHAAFSQEPWEAGS